MRMHARGSGKLLTERCLTGGTNLVAANLGADANYSEPKWQLKLASRNREQNLGGNWEEIGKIGKAAADVKSNYRPKRIWTRHWLHVRAGVKYKIMAGCAHWG
jgi:hypothetical protein